MPIWPREMRFHFDLFDSSLCHSANTVCANANPLVSIAFGFTMPHSDVLRLFMVHVDGTEDVRGLCRLMSGRIRRVRVRDRHILLDVHEEHKHS
jgi:hypothetical protein